MRNAIQTIRDEHRSISAVLDALKQLAKDAEDSGVEPRFEVFRAMIYYIDQFPERLHHPKEDKYLFARVEARAPQASRGDKLHRAGDLLGVLHRADAAPEIEKCGHGR